MPQGGGKSAQPQGGSGFRPTSISNLIAWYDAALGVTLNGSDVSNWADQSGNSNDLAEVTDQPAYTVGPPSFLSFDGVAEDLTCPAVTWATISQPITIFIVEQVQTHTNNTDVFSVEAASSQVELKLLTASRRIAAPTALGGGSAVTDKIIDTIIFNSISSKYYQDGGVATLDGDAGTNDLESLLLGSNTGVAGWAHVDIYEFIVYNKLLSTVELNQLGGHLATKHSLTWTDIS